MKYTEYIERWNENGVANVGATYCDTPMVGLPKLRRDCVSAPVTHTPQDIRLPVKQFMPFIDICLIGV